MQDQRRLQDVISAIGTDLKTLSGRCDRRGKETKALEEANSKIWKRIEDLEDENKHLLMQVSDLEEKVLDGDRKISKLEEENDWRKSDIAGITLRVCWCGEKRPGSSFSLSLFVNKG